MRKIDTLKIEYLDVFNDDRFESIESFLKNHFETSIFSLPRFLKSLLDTYSLKGYYLICSEGRILSGIASFYIKKNFFGKNSLTSVPAGFWAKDINSEKLLIEELKKIANKDNLKGPYFQDLPKKLNSLSNPKILYRAIVDLPEKKEDLLNLYSKNIRRDIQTAQKKGLKIVKDGEFKNFYKVWSWRIRDLGTPVIPFSFFKNMKEVFKDSMSLLFVKKENRYVGGVLILKIDDFALNPYLACLTKTLKYCPVPLLYHKMLCWAVDNGCRYFDLGRSQFGSGNEKFKLRFGAKLKPLYSYSNEKIQNKGLGKKIAVFCWKWLPLSVANYFGPKVRRYIPFG